MKVDSLWITGPQKIEIRSVDVFEPEYGQIQVEVKACGICMGDQALYKAGDANHVYPFRFGHEPAGIVSKVGPGVEGFKLGDNVTCIGNDAMAQVINVPASQSVVISKPVDDYAIWIIEPVVCVVTSIDCVPITPGDDVVLVGAGYMGLMKIQALAKTLRGYLTVLDIDDRVLALAKKFGADEVYNVNSDEGKVAIARMVEAGGAPLVIECSGTESGYETANKLIQCSGLLELFGWQRSERTFDGTAWHLTGLKVYNSAPFIDKNYPLRVGQVEKLMARGVIDQRELITHRTSYKQANEALETAIQKADGYIKGVITF